MPVLFSFEQAIICVFNGSNNSTGEDLVRPIIFRCRLIMQVYYVIAQPAKMLEFSSLNFNVVVATSGKTCKNLLKVF